MMHVRRLQNHLVDPKTNGEGGKWALFPQGGGMAVRTAGVGPGVPWSIWHRFGAG